MAFRTAGVFKLGAANTPQPMFGSWITAGIGSASDTVLTLTLGTAMNAGNDASQIFTNGEPAWLIDPAGGNGESVLIGTVSANTLTLIPQTREAPGRRGGSIVTQYAHISGALGTGTFIFPKQMTNNFLTMYEDGGTGPFFYLGNSPLMTAVFRRVFKLAATTANTAPSFFSAGMYSPGNPYDISEMYVYGASGDRWNVSLNVD